MRIAVVLIWYGIGMALSSQTALADVYTNIPSSLVAPSVVRWTGEDANGNKLEAVIPAPTASVVRYGRTDAIYRRFDIGTNRYILAIDEASITSTPQWVAGAGLEIPVSPEFAVQKAQAALPRYANDTEDWVLRDIELRRYIVPRNWWFYEVTYIHKMSAEKNRSLTPREQANRHTAKVTIFVLMSGDVIDARQSVID